MDSQTAQFQTALDPILPNVPVRSPAAMPAQNLACWTPVSLALAVGGWLMAETPAPITVTAE